MPPAPDPPVTAARRHVMASVRSKNTRPELLVRRYLHAQGLRYRLHARALPGTPDLVLPRHRAVVFVNGCFWHAHADCRHAALPRTRAAFWAAKLGRNVANDLRHHADLRRQGWRVLVVWECALRPAARAATLAALLADLTGPPSADEVGAG